MRSINLNRDEIAAFAKAPKTIRAIENIDTNQVELTASVNAILGAPLLSVTTTDNFTRDRALIGSGDIMLSDGGPKGNVALSLTSSGVSASTYGSAAHAIAVSVDAKGRITLAAQYPLNSDNVAEGSTNLYFTTTRARNALTSGTGINYSPISGVIAIDTTVATLTGTQTLTNKTFNLTSNSLSGTRAQFDAACSDGDFAFLAGAAFTGEVLLENGAPTSIYSAGFRGIPVNQQVADYTLLMSDSGRTLYHEGGTPHTYTIPSNASVPYPRGTRIRFVNRNGAANLTIAITSDTLYLTGAGTTGSRTLAANGMAEAVKTNTTEWHIANMGGLT